MARLWSCGFELNSKVAGVEFEVINTPASASISTSTVRSGNYSLRLNPIGTNTSIFHSVYTANQARIGYARTYLFLASLPNAIQNVLAFTTANSGSRRARLQITTTGAVRLLNSAAAQVGSDSDPLNLNTWYRLELKMDSTTTPGTLAAQINGVSFASGNDNAQNLWGAIEVGWTNTVTVDSFFDDIALNDDTGSFQNSFPGDGSIVHLHPDSAGDATNWTPLAKTNFSQVQEISPDDATSYVSDALTTSSDFYNLEAPPPNLHPTSVIGLVSVGGRFNNPTADATTNFQFQIEKAVSGTVTKSSAITPNTTSWKTNARVIPYVYPLNLYQDPDNLNWTKDTLNSMQIGVITGTIGVFGIQLSTIWALVEYIPSLNSPGNIGKYLIVGDGMSRSEVAN